MYFNKISMMISRTCLCYALFATSICSIFGVEATRNSNLRRRANRLKPPVATIECTVFETEFEAEYDPYIDIDSDIPSLYECIDDNQNTYTLLETSAIDSEFESGVTRIRFSSSLVLEGTTIDLSIASTDDVEILSTDAIITAAAPYRTTRERYVAVIRVTSNDDEPTNTAEELADDIFGINGDEYNLRSGYELCSGGKLKMLPGEGNGLVDGVLDLIIDMDTSGVPARTVEAEVKAALASEDVNFPAFTGGYNHVLFVLPRNVNFGLSGGYAAVNGKLSVYKDTHASMYQVLMHEIGHNLGQQHSGINHGSAGEDKYGDATDMMSSLRPYHDDGPAMCFNGAKSYYLGFYNDRHYEVQPSIGTGDIHLVSIDDYLNEDIETNADEHAVVMRLHDTNENIFVMYNQAKGVNAGVVGSQNKVTIVEQEGPRKQSWFLGALDEGETYRKEDWNGSGNALVIEVCSMETGSPDYAHVITYVEGVNYLSCDGSTTPPPPPSSNVRVSYYSAGLSFKKLPTSGMKSLTPYKMGMVDTIDYSKVAGEFGVSGRNVNLAALFEGSLSFPDEDDGSTASFCITSDDGAKLLVDGALIINNDGLHGVKKECGDVVLASAAAAHSVEVEFFKKGKKPTIILEMKAASESSYSTIPKERWGYMSAPADGGDDSTTGDDSSGDTGTGGDETPCEDVSAKPTIKVKGKNKTKPCAWFAKAKFGFCDSVAEVADICKKSCGFCS